MTVAAKAWNNPTNHSGGIFTGFDEQGGDQRAGGCFSVTPRHGNRSLLIDEGSEEIRSMPDRQLMGTGVLQLWVGVGDRCADHHHRWLKIRGEHRLNAFSGLLFKNGDAPTFKMLNRGVVAGV